MRQESDAYSASELRRGISLKTGQSHTVRLKTCPCNGLNGVFSCSCWQAQARNPESASTLRKLWSRFGKLLTGLGMIMPGLIEIDENPYTPDDDGAAKAVKHYLSGTGAFVEIPQAKVSSMRTEWEETHLKRAYAAFQHGIRQEGLVYSRFHGGARNVLALTWLTTKSGQALPISEWPESCQVSMSYADGPQVSWDVLGFAIPKPHAVAKWWLSSEYRDDWFEYFGSTIRSEVVIECSRVRPFSYSMAIVEWRSYVVDNYDWEGDKDVRLPGFPTQQEMRRLAAVGCARAYERSSCSWLVPVRPFDAWAADYDPPHDLTAASFVECLAHDRRAMEMQPVEQDALPPPGPAESISGRKTYGWFEPDDPEHTCERGSR